MIITVGQGVSNQLVGYWGSKCPNGGDKTHVHPVYISTGPQTTPTNVQGMTYPPGAETGWCKACADKADR